MNFHPPRPPRRKQRLLIVFGTRPEALKCFPVVQAARADSRLVTQVCVTGQHRDMLDQVLELTGMPVDFDLDIMAPGQSLFDVTTRVLTGMERVLAEARPDIVMVQGDTTTAMAAALQAALGAQFPFLDASRKLILVTGHRRENFDGGIDRICTALKVLASRGDVQIVYPVHPNPKVREVVEGQLRDVPNIHLIGPQDYLPFLYLQKRSYLVLTDSGGVQEEAPSLGKPVLVMRENTERPEGVAAGTARLVGTDVDVIVANAARLLDDTAAYRNMAERHNPYGDGRASARIIEELLRNE
jgi:UDP-N-acetylglucosamine 2-epimerase